MFPPRIRLLPDFVCSSCRSKAAQPRLRTRKDVLTPTTRTLSTTPRHLAAPPSSAVPSNSSFSGIGSLADMFGPNGTLNPPSSSNQDNAAMYAAEAQQTPQPHRLHIYCTKHNTHMTLTRPAPPPQKFDPQDVYKPPPPNQPVMSYAAGNIGFKKAGRGTYDAAYQLASFVFKQIQERGLLGEIKQIEVVMREFGAGREAVTKALLGQEGRLLRNRIVAVTDATRLKFGGSRSPNPRRLG